MSVKLKTGQVKVNVNGNLETLDVMSASTQESIATIQAARDQIIESSKGALNEANTAAAEARAMAAEADRIVKDAKDVIDEVKEDADTAIGKANLAIKTANAAIDKADATINTANTAIDTVTDEANRAIEGIAEKQDEILGAITDLMGKKPDTTLTMTGVPADAKVIGNHLKDINNDINNILEASNKVFEDKLVSFSSYETGNISLQRLTNKLSYPATNTNNNMLRTKENVFVALEEGDVVFVPSDLQMKYYVKVDGTYTTEEGLTGEINIENSGDYAFVFSKPSQSSTITDVKSFLNGFYIKQKNTPIAKIYENENKIAGQTTQIEQNKNDIADVKGDIAERWENKVYTDELSKYLVRRGNLVDISYSMAGYDIETTNIPSLKYIEVNGKDVSDYIPVKAGDVLKINTSISYVCFDKSKVWDEKLRKYANNSTFTIENDGYIRFAYAPSTNPILTKESDEKEDVAYSFEKLNIDPEQIKGNIKIENDELSIFRKYDDFFYANNYFSYDKDSKPYKATYNGTFKYPFEKTLYNINGDVTLYFLFDATFDFEASNVAKVSEVHYGFNNVNTITKISVDDDGHFTFIGKISGSGLSNACFEWGFRSFTLKDSNDTEYNIVFTINTIQLLVIGETYKNKFPNDLLKKLLIAKGVNRDGNLNLYNSNYVKHADLSELSNETNFVRTGWYGKKICTFGDSTIAQERWQPFMAKRLGCTYTNRGIGGTCWEVKEGESLSENDIWKNNTSYTTDARINTIDADADMLVVFGGFNDYDRFVDVPINFSENKMDESAIDLNPTSMQGAISLFVKKVRALHPKIKILIACMPFGFENPSRAVSHKIRKAMREACEFNSVDFVDMYALCQWNYQNTAEYHSSGDYIHFNDNDGAKIIAGIVCDALRKYEPFD